MGGSDEPLSVSFLTDVEGNFEYMRRFVAISDALEELSILKDGSLDLELRDGWRFVFGGDAVDKGHTVGGSIRVVKTLVRLKKKYPERVTLLLGNRDVNKIRFSSELDPEQIQQLEGLPGPDWVPENKRITPLMFLTKLVAHQLNTSPESVTAEQLSAANTMANRVRYILRETMGADGEFERRIEELAFLVGGGRPSEEQVARSFHESVTPGGFMREFLSLGQLIERIGDTIFVHGGLACGVDHCLGFIPGHEGRIEQVDTWIAALNGWLRDQLDEWKANPKWRAPDRSASDSLPARSAEALLNYILPGRLSVVTGRHLMKDGMPMPMPEELMRLLNPQGIYRLCCGHTPHGCCPTVIKSGGPLTQEPHFQVIMADTSYSDMGSPDNRGKCVSEVQLLVDGRARVHGLIKALTPSEGDAAVKAAELMDPKLSPSGEDHLDRIDYTLALGVGPEKEFMGQMQGEAEARRFVKAYMPQLKMFLLCRVQGFITTYDELSARETRELFGGELSPPASPEKEEALEEIESMDTLDATIFSMPEKNSGGSTRHRSPFGCSSVRQSRDRKIRKRQSVFQLSLVKHLDDHDEKNPHEEREKLARHMFQQIDQSGDGIVDMKELITAFETNSSFVKLVTQSDVQPSDDAAKILLTKMDADQNGQVSEKEFTDFFVQNEFTRIHENSVQVIDADSCVGIEESAFGRIFGGTTGCRHSEDMSSSSPSTMNARATPKSAKTASAYETTAFKTRPDVKIDVDEFSERRRAQRQPSRRIDPQAVAWENARANCKCWVLVGGFVSALIGLALGLALGFGVDDMSTGIACAIGGGAWVGLFLLVLLSYAATGGVWPGCLGGGRGAM